MSGIPPKIDNVMQTIKSYLDSGRYLDTRHVTERQEQRGITRSEMVYVLRNGHHEKRKDRFDDAYKAWSYSVRGKTIDRRELRIVISFDEETGMLIITAIDLDK